MKYYDSTWRFGANFIPSNAINQLEMWQAETFSPALIQTELAWAAQIGMSVMRVYLHDLVYEQNPSGFLRRVDEYLAIADKLKIKTILVIFDDCWNSEFALGKQPDPVPMKHNSGWVQSPGFRAADNMAEWPRLEKYVKAVLTHFKHDQRILLWDLYNEPGNGTAGDHSGSQLRGEKSLPLLQAVFEWARAIPPDQPLTSGLWRFSDDFAKLNEFAAKASEVVSFHNYGSPESMQACIDQVKALAAGRPLVCTEYMARTAQSTFAGSLPLLKQNNITAINWGLAAGKSNTIYPWGWSADKGEPPQWFHDVFYPDGRLLYPEEGEVFAAVR